MISESNLAKKLGRNRSTLYRWRKLGRIKPIFQDGSRVLYDEKEVRKIVDKST